VRRILLVIAVAYLYAPAPVFVWAADLKGHRLLNAVLIWFLASIPLSLIFTWADRQGVRWNTKVRR
jgi:hypothetical protein